MSECIDQLRRGSAEEAAAVEPGCLEHARRLISLFDAMSLWLLGALPNDVVRPSEIVTFGDQESALRVVMKDDRVRVTPWPFVDDEVRLTTRALRLERSTFPNAAQWRHDLERASESQVEWCLIS